MYFSAKAIYGSKTGRPLVEVEFGVEKVTLTYGEAITLSQMLVAAAEAALTDAAWITELKAYNTPMSVIGNMLLNVRNKRTVIEQLEAAAHAQKENKQDEVIINATKHP